MNLNIYWNFRTKVTNDLPRRSEELLRRESLTNAPFFIEAGFFFFVSSFAHTCTDTHLHPHTLTHTHAPGCSSAACGWDASVIQRQSELPSSDDVARWFVLTVWTVGFLWPPSTGQTSWLDDWANTSFLFPASPSWRSGHRSPFTSFRYFFDLFPIRVHGSLVSLSLVELK